METIGFVGVGKIGLPISENLIKSGYRVLGYRRGSLAEFEKIGGVAGAFARRHRRAGGDRVLVPAVVARRSTDVVQGPNGLAKSARPGQIMVELGSHPVPDKERHVAPLAAKGAAFIDGEVSGTPGMVAARKAVIYLAGDAEACKKAERVVGGFADSCLYFGKFGAASRVKLVNNLLVALNIAATAEAMALGLKAGVDVDLMIKAIATGSGGSTQFGIRAPWMAQRRFLPAQGTVPALAALLRHDRRLRRRASAWRRRCSTARSSSTTSSSRWALPRRMSPPWSTSSARCRARRPSAYEQARTEVRMIRVKKIAHAVYEMPDVDKQTEYYTEILGLTVTGKDKDAVYLASTVDHHSVVLRKGSQPKCVRLGFQIGPEDDLDGVRAPGAGPRASRPSARRTPSRRSPTCSPSRTRRAPPWRCSSAKRSPASATRPRASCRTSSATSPSSSPTSSR